MVARFLRCILGVRFFPDKYKEDNGKKPPHHLGPPMGVLNEDCDDGVVILYRTFNPFKPIGLSHPYQVDGSISN